MSKTSKLTDELSDEELDRLSDFLDAQPDSMNLEIMDGFLAALICAPDTIPMGEVFSKIWGDDMEFETHEQAQEIATLIMRHWNTIAGRLRGNDLHYPLLFENENGIAAGNDWAQGFYQGMGLSESWDELLNNEEQGGCLFPILILVHEHDPDPELRPYPQEIDAEQRDQILIGVIAGLKQIYDYFSPHRAAPARKQTGIARSGPKIGRNEPCPCGSGRKYKHCCLDKSTALH